jgi:hypothetical protein
VTTGGSVADGLTGIVGDTVAGSYREGVRAFVIAAAVGLLVGLLAHVLGVLLIVLGVLLVGIGVLLTLTAIGAVIGIPLGFLGGFAILLGAFGVHGTAAAVVLGTIAGLVAYLRLERREARPIH